MIKKHVLVIDDENSVRKIICDNLKLAGFDVASATDGEEGLAITPGGAARNTPLLYIDVDLVLLLAIGAANWLTQREYRAAQIDPFSLEALVPNEFAGWVVDRRADILVVSP